MNNAIKLKFSSYVHLSSINKKFQYPYARVIMCNVVEVIIFEDGRCISGLEHVRILILSSHFLLACILRFYNLSRGLYMAASKHCGKMKLEHTFI